MNLTPTDTGVVCVHEGRRVIALGLCNTCYKRHRRRANPGSYRRAYLRVKNDPRQYAMKRARSKRRYAERERSSKVIRQQRNATLKRKYGITLSQFEEMLEFQGGVCAICKRNPHTSGRALHVDHDKRTGKIRGLLCYRCNHGLGWFSEKPARLLRAAKYLHLGVEALYED